MRCGFSSVPRFEDGRDVGEHFLHGAGLRDGETAKYLAANKLSPGAVSTELNRLDIRDL
jgi:hypothetical protein